MESIEKIGLGRKGFCPLVEYESWSVGALQYQEKFQQKNLSALERHNETDEVFVLLQGTCLLFDGGFGDAPQKLEALRLEPLKVYNVKKGAWHIHMLSADAVVLLVENAGTCRSNTSESPLSESQKDWMRAVCAENGITVL